MKFHTYALWVFGLLGVLTAMLNAADDKVDLKKGDPAPEFKSTDDKGKAWKSTDHVGKKVVVVYFYPADFTGGCTTQACSFRDDMQPITQLGAEVVGVSGDSVKTHILFKQHYKLNYTLLADEQGAIARAFGVPVTGGALTNLANLPKESIEFLKEHGVKKIQRGVTAKRWTFVIDKDGAIAYKNANVKAADDSKQILKVVEGLARK